MILVKAKKLTPAQKKQKKLDIFVVATFCYIFLFVVVSWVAYFLTGSVPDTLVEVGLGGGVIELAATAAIEIFTGHKVKRDEEE